MSGLSMRTRIITVVSSAAIIAPFALMGGSANAAESDLPIDALGVTDGLGLGVVDGVLGTATGLLGSTGIDPLSTVTGSAADPTSAMAITEDLPLGSLVDLDVLETVTSLLDLENVLSTVTGLVNIDDVLKTVTDLIDLNDLLDLDLDKLINLPVKVNSPSVKGAHSHNKDAKDHKSTVKAGALPHTGGNADMTAMLLCAGLAVAGTGVTMVTRRRNALLGA